MIFIRLPRHAYEFCKGLTPGNRFLIAMHLRENDLEHAVLFCTKPGQATALRLLCQCNPVAQVADYIDGAF